MRGHKRRPEFAKVVAKRHDLNWTALGRIERGEAVLKKGWRDALIEELNVPESWLTGELDGGTPEHNLAARLDQIEDKLDTLLEIPPEQVVQRVAAVVREHFPPNGGPE